MENTAQLFIFKTYIVDLCKNCEVYKALDRHTDVMQWSVDTDDVDHVLRVKSANLSSVDIVSILNNLGHECHELN
jgi:hypothetical protein